MRRRPDVNPGHAVIPPPEYAPLHPGYETAGRVRRAHHSGLKGAHGAPYD